MTFFQHPAQFHTDVYTIPSGWPFVDALALGLGNLTSASPETLAATTIFLPTRRACRALSEAFLRQSKGQALLLPRMIPLGDTEDEGLLIQSYNLETLNSDGSNGEIILDTLPAITSLRRQLILARLIMARPKVDTRPDQAMFLALELAKLLDQTQTEQLDFSALSDLVPSSFADHWQITLDFLKLLTNVWPKLLESEGVLDPSERRNRLLQARAQTWLKAPPNGPVIAAGSTGSIPATADLLKVIAGLHQGIVVLPGLDLDASDDTWNCLAPSHPQFGMAKLIKHLDITRQNVAIWPAEPGVVASKTRSKLINAALTPAEAKIPRFPDQSMLTEALNGVTRVDCPGTAEEAQVIALMMRRALESPNKTAALVTPDRNLARRVAAALNRWGVKIDDSAGYPLAQSTPGIFLRLTAAAVADGLSPVKLLALLKHPMTRVGLEAADCRSRARALELAVLRGPKLAPGPSALYDSLRSMTQEVHPDLIGFLTLFVSALSPLLKTFETEQCSLSELVQAHVASAEALARPGNGSHRSSGAARLWAGDAGETAADLMQELAEAANAIEQIDCRDYPAFFEAACVGRVVRPKYGTHSRLFIWGLMEARLQHADLTILGSLNEGSWPPEAPSNPWMSRPMMEVFGLPVPERRLGLTAHDFVQGFGAPRVVLTRATKLGGAPTVPSRWLRRLDNLLEKEGLTDALKDESPWVDWAESLDTPPKMRVSKSPCPMPHAKARPRRLSVTEIETLIRDPYAIYAKHILRLNPIDPLQADPGASDRGIIIHRILDEFIKTFPDELPKDAEYQLNKIGKAIFSKYLTRPGVYALWWPRFQRIANWFITNEINRRGAGFRPLITEALGDIEIAGIREKFTITARVDRIDHKAGNGYTIIDYKTGAPPTAKQVRAGWNPQLPLEAAILQKRGFSSSGKIYSGPVAELVYMQLSGGRNPGEEQMLKLETSEVIENTLIGVTKLIHLFEDPKTPYLSQPRPQFLNRYGDYDHLSRVKEWRTSRRR